MRWNQTSLKPYMNHDVEYGAFAKLPVGTSLGALSNQHHVTYCDVMQPLV